MRVRSPLVRAVVQAVIVLAGLAVAFVLLFWWVIPTHSFEGPVLVTLSHSHGIHVGDLTGVALTLWIVERTLWLAGRVRLARTPERV